MEITREQLKNILSEINNPTWVGFTSRTPEKMNQYLNYWLIGEGGSKTKNPNPTPNPYFQNGIWKVSKKYRIITGFDYEKSVNRRLEKEGKESNFVSGEGKEVWFDIISKGLVTDKRTHTKFYFRYQHLKDSVIGTPEYFYNGNPIMKQLFEDYLTQRNSFYENQGLDNPLMFQVCDLENIEKISINEEHFELI